jgi:hypothetical protein
MHVYTPGFSVHHIPSHRYAAAKALLGTAPSSPPSPSNANDASGKDNLKTTLTATPHHRRGRLPPLPLHLQVTHNIDTRKTKEGANATYSADSGSSSQLTHSMGASGRHVVWYTSAADREQLADELRAATGVYSCCGRITIAANGSLFSVGATQLAKDIAAARSLGLPAVHVIGVAASLEFNKSTAAALSAAAAEIAALTSASNATGVMVDYETSLFHIWGPARSRAVANGYAHWATELAAAVHSRQLTVGLDLAGDDGGSPIDMFDVFAANASTVDTLMLMSTYSDTFPSYKKEMVTRALTAGIPAAQLSVGLGTVSAAEPTRYPWNASALSAFIHFVVQQNVTALGIWRSDIDVYKGKIATAPYFLDALEMFLASPPSGSTSSSGNTVAINSASPPSGSTSSGTTVAINSNPASPPSGSTSSGATVAINSNPTDPDLVWLREYATMYQASARICGARNPYYQGCYYPPAADESRPQAYSMLYTRDFEYTMEFMHDVLDDVGWATAYNESLHILDGAQAPGGVADEPIFRAKILANLVLYYPPPPAAFGAAPNDNSAVFCQRVGKVYAGMVLLFFGGQVSSLRAVGIHNVAVVETMFSFSIPLRRSLSF